MIILVDFFFATENVSDATHLHNRHHLLYTIGIKYSWFCRRIEEQFTDDYLLRNPSARDSGCFGNSKFKLEESYGGFTLLNDEGSKISVTFFYFSIFPFLEIYTVCHIYFILCARITYFFIFLKLSNERVDSDAGRYYSTPLRWISVCPFDYRNMNEKNRKGKN